MKQLINSTSEPGWPNIEVEFDRPIELFVDNFNGYDPNKKSFKILWVKESEEISKFKSHAIEHHKKFDAVITYDEDVLNQCDNSYFMPFGSTWISEFDFSRPKFFSVSHLTGHKNWLSGHKLRHEIHFLQNEIKIPKNFFVSKHGGPKIFENNRILGETKNNLFDSQFHICIENNKQKNYFTEKLIDCFITKTIPIYYGCPNISDFFNTEGFFIVENAKEIIQIINNLDENQYFKMLSFVEENYKLSLQFSNLTENFREKIQNILNNGNF
jgi:hypothetical protein